MCLQRHLSLLCGTGEGGTREGRTGNEGRQTRNDRRVTGTEEVNRLPTGVQKKGKKIRTADTKCRPPLAKKNGFRLWGGARGVGGNLNSIYT